MNSIILDCGAYSAANQDIELDLGEYAQFLRDNASKTEAYISLDVIPGTIRGREWRADRIEAAAAQSYRHQQILKDRGFSPVPVFHQDEIFSWLERYLADGEPYIALSTNKTAHRKEHMEWLDDCFAILKGASVKTHGLGLTSNLICERHPWTSLDSGRWFKAAAYGQVLVPFYSNDRPDYSLAPRTVFVTDKMLGHHKHINALADRAVVERYLREEVNCELADVRHGHYHRHRACAIYLHHAIGPRLYFVVNSFQQANLLAECGVRNLLVSYFYLRRKPADTLERYKNPAPSGKGRGSKVVSTVGSGKNSRGQQCNGHRRKHQTQ